MTSIKSTIASQVLFRSLFQFKWLINCACHFSMRMIYGNYSNYKTAIFFFCQNSMKVYSEPLEQDMKSIDAADIKP